MKLFLVAAAFGLAACTGGSATEPEAADTSTDSRVEADIAEATAVAVKLLELSGGDAITPSVALLVAADRGYPHADIITAIADDRFLLDGILTDTAGAHVRPTGTDTGIITDKPAVQTLRRSPSQAVTTFGLADQLLLDLELVDLTAVPPAPPASPPRIWDADTVGTIEARNMFLVARITNLRNQGRSVEDIVNAIIFGDIDLCIDEFDEEHTLCDNRELQAQRSNEPANTEPPPAEPGLDAPIGDDDVGFESGSYLGAMEYDTGEIDGAVTLENSVGLDVDSDSIVGDITFLFESGFLGDQACFSLFVPIEVGDLAVSGAGSFAGPVTAQGALDLDSGCSNGAAQTASEAATATVSITVSGASLTGVLDFGDEAVTFNATLVE